MTRFNIIRSDRVYRDLLDLPLAEREAYFRQHLLDYFKEKFEKQRITYQSSEFDAYQMLGMAHLMPEMLDEKAVLLIDRLDEEFWTRCQEGLEEAEQYFVNEGFKPTIESYQFTALLGNQAAPAMFLNQYYGGDGGIPGYIFLSIVPNAYTLPRVQAAIAHEMNHNIRYQAVDWDGGSLVELMIAEGLAENFVEELYGSDLRGPWVTSIDWQVEGPAIKQILSQQLEHKDLFNSMPYLYGDELTRLSGGRPLGLPHCAGYTCGYYLVKYYLQKTQQKIAQATLLPAGDIVKEVSEFWNDPIL
ncbi:DUF2268 domain-containing protein [Facklamia lactis]|uniref:DUF2268 domain-containing protein n=1 Tax=Facklamia lactis TaxID=2749967 RepID=UPI0018CE99D6|nr:DUF2268 domain-containing putative Zn-dependent protease [Facklamia lactis]MBG9979578.1 metallopeptidase [Facklamia lactis]